MTSRRRLDTTTELKETRDQRHQSLPFTNDTSLAAAHTVSNVQNVSQFVFASQCAIF